MKNKKKEKRYYVYHVPGVKIGMTNNIKRRVHDEQGYSTNEYGFAPLSLCFSSVY